MSRIGILLLAIFFAIATGILIFAGAALVHPGALFDAVWRLKPDREPVLMAHRDLLGPFFLGLAVPMALASFGCFTRKRWARWLAMAIFAANGLGDLVQLAAGHMLEGAIGVAAAGLLIAFLMSRAAARAFVR